MSLQNNNNRRENSSESSTITNSANDKVMSRNEAILHAMIQNAKESDWRTNLSNASLAHHRFVLPGQHPSHEQGSEKHKQEEDEFVRKLMERSDRVMEEQREEVEKKRLKVQDAKVETFSSWNDSR
mmetsp:Transcript_4858/g.6324  ORF Transcript_4858/g.6324 Transcript_4858/m.6324 type:complete len:126 (+) Transcript_4858:1-378(+)